MRRLAYKGCLDPLSTFPSPAASNTSSVSQDLSTVYQTASESACLSQPHGSYWNDILPVPYGTPKVDSGDEIHFESG